MFTAVYDLAKSPVSYDVLAFLVRARMLAGSDTLHVAIEPKTDGLGGFSRHWGGYDEAETRWRLWNIVIPACQLAGATVELRQQRGGPGMRIGHFVGDVIQAAKAGHQVPLLTASEYAKRIIGGRYRWAGRLVTITLRDTTDESRNSRAGDWHEAKIRIAEHGFDVIELADSRVLAEDWEIEPVIGNLDLRLALYERAAMNFFVQNGPAALCWHSRAPFMQFGCGGHHVQPPAESWARHFRDMGLAPGEQLPWAKPDQRLLYAPDTLDEISAAFCAWNAGRQKAA